MRIFVAGSTGAIGTQLIAKLTERGHDVFGMSRTEQGAEKLKKLGASPYIADALEPSSLYEAIHEAQPEVVIEMLTSLPKEYTPQTMKESAEGNRILRLKGGANLQNAAESCGVQRYILQSSSFWYAQGNGLATEETPFAIDPSSPIAALAKVYAEQEERLFNGKNIEGVALRFGFFYGPGTWYDINGSMGRQVMEGKIPIVGDGEGVWNFIHVEDAAAAIVLALDCPEGAYNIVNDNPLQQKEWLPAFAKWLNAPPPPRKTEEEELQANGPISLYYATKLRGASNAKAKKVLGFEPRPLEWLGEGQR